MKEIKYLDGGPSLLIENFTFASTKTELKPLPKIKADGIMFQITSENPKLEEVNGQYGFIPKSLIANWDEL